MITKITESNAALYQGLFKDASMLLGKWDSETDSPTENGIIALENYFANLKDIKEEAFISQPSQKYKYLRLPLDEEPFEIDANTRKITIPKAFRDGVAVQGDELAEIVYFRIDRYFDAKDLGADRIKKIILWTNSAGENGYSVASFVDLYAEEGKIIFGWPITNLIAKQAGIIKFSIRFYDFGEDISEDEDINTRQAVYSFNTLPTTIRVNSSLDFDLQTAKKEDKEDDVLDRIFNSSLGGLVVADTPYYYNVIAKASTDSPLPANIDLARDYLKVMGIAPDSGIITYSWQYKNPDTGAWNMLYSSDEPDNTIINLFIKVTDLEDTEGVTLGYDEHIIYYVKSDDVAASGGAEGRVEHPVTSDGKTYESGVLTSYTFTSKTVISTDYDSLKDQLYYRYSAYKVNKGATEYRSKITNNVYGSTSTIVSNICVVQGPETIVIVRDLVTQFEIWEDRTSDRDNTSPSNFIGHSQEQGNTENNIVEFKITAAANNVDSYQWYKDNNEIEGATTATYTISQEGTYQCIVTRSRNNSYTYQQSKELNATYRPKLLQETNTEGSVGYYYKGTGVVTIDNNKYFNSSQDLTLVVVCPESEMVDRAVPTLHYEWCYVDEENLTPIPGVGDTNVLPGGKALAGYSVRCKIKGVKGNTGYSEFISTTSSINAMNSSTPTI